MKEKIKVSLMSLCSLLAIGLNVPAFLKVLTMQNFTAAIDNGLTIGLFGSLIVFILFYRLYLSRKKLKTKVIPVLSVIFSLFMIFGYSYMHYETSFLVFNSLLNFLLATLQFCGYYFIFTYLLNYLFLFFDKHQFKELKSKFAIYFKNHPFKVSILVILLCWLPYIIAFYPIILSPDPTFQIKQFFL